MSIPVKPLQLDFLTKKDTVDFLFSDDSDDEFNFEYLSKSQFKDIIKDVRQQRLKKKVEMNWECLSQEASSDGLDYNYEDYLGVSNMQKPMYESIKPVNTGLKRLKKNSVREKRKDTSDNDIADKTVANVKEQNQAPSPRGIAQTKKMLITIPEEIPSVLGCERTPVSKLECSARKCNSECTMREKIKSLCKFNDAVNDAEYNYSSGLSKRYEGSDGEATREIRPHPVVAQKILGIQKKISESLDEIALRLDRIPRPDGERDLQRRKQRVTEFAIRFSRNYLYDLGRQITDIQRHVRAISPSARTKPRRAVLLHMQAIEQKLISAHQLLLYALSAYCKHVPCSVLKGHPGKLKEVLQVLVDLKNICVKVHLTIDFYGCGDVEPSPLGNDTQKRCDDLLSKLRVCSDNESKLVSPTTQSIPIGGLRNKNRSNITDSYSGLPARLSMYSMNARLSRNPESRKLASPSFREKISSSVLSQIPPTRHPTTPEQLIPNASLHKSSGVIGKRRKTKIWLPQREDEISTMMSTLATDSDAASSVTVSRHSHQSELIHTGSDSKKCSRTKPPPNHSICLNMPIEGARQIMNEDKCTERASQVTDQELSHFVPVIADLMTLASNQNDVKIEPVPSDLMEVLMKLLKKYRSSFNPNIPVHQDEQFDARISPVATEYQNLRESTNKSIETQSSVKNMQLLCFTSRDNAGETHSSNTSETCCGKIDGPQETAMNFNQLLMARNSEMMTLNVNKLSLNTLLKYRDEYQRSHCSNPTYTSNTRNKAWHVVAWIADKLVDELIVDVSKELQIEDAIRELYVQEFNEF